MKKDKWIDEIMSSTEKVQKLPISEDLRGRLNSIPREVRLAGTTIPLKAVWFTAASIALLITLNITSISAAKQKNAAEDNNRIYTDYFSYIDEF